MISEFHVNSELSFVPHIKFDKIFICYEQKACLTPLSHFTNSSFLRNKWNDRVIDFIFSFYVLYQNLG